MDAPVSRLLSTFRSLQQASDQLESDAPSKDMLNGIVESGLVRPADNELLAYWFARYLSVRQSLWNLINDCIESGDRDLHGLTDEQVWSHFVVGYCAACLLIKNDQAFLFDIASHSVVQRKFNEAFVEYRIPRKQYTKIFSAFVDSRRTYLQRLLAYVSHKWRRKSVVVLNNMLSTAVENVGRAASEIQLPLDKRVSKALRVKMIDKLEPGDVLVTRHDTAVTNLFIPGFWPHAALYVGTVEQRQAMGIEVDAETEIKWSAEACVLEALKDGVRFRPITETLAVDNFVVLRPNLNAADIKRGIERVVLHEGKLYNFDFDFFSSERLVCSEVVYRAFDGLGDVSFPLTERAGRHTLSPEDLVNFALQTDNMQVMGVYGVGVSRHHYTQGELAEELVQSTIDSESTNGADDGSPSNTGH